MNIDKKDIEKLADLSKLQLTEEQILDMKSDLDKILAFVEKLRELDVDHVEPLRYMTSNENVLRKDEMKSDYSQEQALKNAPQKDSDYIKVPKVLRKG